MKCILVSEKLTVYNNIGVYSTARCMNRIVKLILNIL